MYMRIIWIKRISVCEGDDKVGKMSKVSIFPFSPSPRLKEFAVWFYPLTVNGTMPEDTNVQK